MQLLIRIILPACLQLSDELGAKTGSQVHIGDADMAAALHDMEQSTLRAQASLREQEDFAALQSKYGFISAVSPPPGPEG